MSIFRQRNVHFLKITLPSCPNFVKTSVFSKNCAIMSFFQIGHKKSPALMPVFDIKLSILLKLHQFMGQKSQQNTFFFNFSQQRLLSCSYFVKKHLFPKKHAFYVHILCQKIPILSKTQCSLLIFFQIYYEKPQLSCPHLVNKTSIQTKLKYIMGQKVNKMPFFTTFHEKNNALMPICYPKTSIL